MHDNIASPTCSNVKASDRGVHRFVVAAISACVTLLFAAPSQAATAFGGADEKAAPVKLATLGSMTWGFYDAAAVTAYPTESAQIADAMNQTINNYNTVAAYTTNVGVTYVTWGGVTAQATFNGGIQFGYMRSGRTAQHELSHVMGMYTWAWGGKSNWRDLCVAGWQNTIALARMRTFKPTDGIGCSADVGHFWDYGLNQDGEYNWLSKGRNIAMVGAMRADMGLSDGSTLPNALYRLVSKTTGTPVADKISADAGEVIEATSTVSRKQAWDISFNGGYIRLKNLASQRYLDGSGGTATMVTASAPGATQTWEMIPTSNGYFMLRNQGTDMCLKSTGNTTPGASLQLAACDTNWTPASNFEFHLAQTALPTGMPYFGSAVQIAPTNFPTYRLTVDQAGRGVMTNFSQNPTAGSVIQAGGGFHVRRGLSDPVCVSFESINRPNNFLRHQNFNVYLGWNDGSGLFKADATFCPQDGYTGAGNVTLQSANFPTHVVRHQNFINILSPSNGGAGLNADATFAITPINEKSAAPVVGVQSSRCIDVKGGSTANQTQNQLWDCNGGANQAWTYNVKKELKVYGSKCMDAWGDGKTNGTAVLIWDCNGGGNQQWNLNADGSVTGVSSGLCLDATGKGTTNGTLLQLSACTGQANQKWKFK